MKIALLNVRGLRDQAKMAKVLEWVKSFRIDILFLFETHLTPDLATIYSRQWHHMEWLTNAPQRNAVGISVVVINPSRVVDCKVMWSDGQSRGLLVEFTPEAASRRSISALYAPNSETEKCDFLNRMSDVVEDFRPDFVLGDFNAIEAACDRNSVHEDDVRVRNALNRCLHAQDHFYIDGWRDTYPEKQQYTWWGTNDVHSAARLDRIYVRPRVFRKCIT